MKRKMLISSMAATLLLGFGMLSVAQASVSTKAAKVASITLYGKSDDNQCSFNLEVGKQYTMKGQHGCKNDDYYYFKITNGKPNTLVVFMDHPQCGHSQPTYEYLIVGDEGEVLNMQNKRELAHDGSSGQYLEDYLETRGAPKKGRLGGKLSCVAAW